MVNKTVFVFQIRFFVTELRFTHTRVKRKIGSEKSEMERFFENLKLSNSHLVNRQKDKKKMSLVLKRVKVILKIDTFFWLKIDKSYDKKCSYIPLVLGLGVYLPKF